MPWRPQHPTHPSGFNRRTRRDYRFGRLPAGSTIPECLTAWLAGPGGRRLFLTPRPKRPAVGVE